MPEVDGGRGGIKKKKLHEGVDCLKSFGIPGLIERNGDILFFNVLIVRSQAC